MSSLFDTVLDPLRAEGVNFWWLDWQQWPDSKKLPGLSNTWWLNYVFYTHMQRGRQGPRADLSPLGRAG